MNWIREIRNDLLLTQADLAALVGVQVFTVSRWENGHCEPHMRNIKRLRDLKNGGSVGASILRGAQEALLYAQTQKQGGSVTGSAPANPET